ncbi:type-2 restriction enzyme SalI [Richelia sinica FACHB-800]|uniref:Type-2 restriction enzyme SalI n=1 Tax=Richelia sinica FACHB-800 TaxID=1357546 RepID=A0A975T5R5_9NOST|nr:XamI family restriction endonuclease [Richelia sinica]MBD2663063.1 XamI family restriction endonuclease [Richelia sinica FACHB-800]QXE21926.1 type-2 restriction enzyme SalI [Richelia sinica FACHB-800]
MPVNADKPHLWKQDIAQSVDFYNSWFMEFAPRAYLETRIATTQQVESALTWTANLTNITPTVLRQHPSVLPIMRMTTAPPIARDRLIGLAGVSPNLVKNMEDKQRIPPKMDTTMLDAELAKISQVIARLIDRDIFPWLETKLDPNDIQIHRAATIVADRLCGALADPIIRNTQEQRQLATIRQWLEERGYSYIRGGSGLRFETMQPGTFVFRLNIPVSLQSGNKQVNIPIDAVIMPRQSAPGDLPLLIEAKSAGDFTNPNKRRKEEAIKVAQLRSNYGNKVRFVLFLCGYFDSGYLGYEAAEGIDWLWEHRIDDLALFGV